MAGNDTLYPHLAIPRELAERLIEHYADDPEVRSVPDALRAAAREVVECAEA